MCVRMRWVPMSWMWVGVWLLTAAFWIGIPKQALGARLVVMSSSDSGVVRSGGEDVGQEVARRSRKRRKTVASTIWGAIFGVRRRKCPPEVSDLVFGLSGCSAQGALVEASPEDASGLLGLVEIEWSLHTRGTSSQPAFAMQRWAGAIQRHANPFFVHYTVKQAYALPSPVVLDCIGHGRAASLRVFEALSVLRPGFASLHNMVFWRPLAEAVVQGRWSVVHCAGFSATSHGLRSAFGGAPSLAAALEAAQKLPAQPGPTAGEIVPFASAPNRSLIRPAIEAHSMVGFVRGSRHLRALGACEDASLDILKAEYPEKWQDIRASRTHRWPGRVSLQTARARFDMAIALSYRALSQAAASEKTPFDVYLFLDGSPTSGFEALAIVQQEAIGEDISERILPLTYLGFGHMAAVDKIFALLWVLFLECGPDLAAIR